MTFETVHSITHFYDRPREGVADFEGAPHFFASEWDSAADDYADTFRLGPVTPEVLALALESRANSNRWWTAFYGAQVTDDAGRVLPEDRSRHDELQRALKEHLRIDPTNFVRVRGRFRSVPGWNGAGMAPSEVEWIRC